jgi:hypothetical protein
MATKSTDKATSLVKRGAYLCNPLFDKRIYSVGGLRGTSGGYVQPENTNSRTKTALTRGYMVTAGNQMTFDKKRYRVDFLYNPSTVAMQHSIDGEVASAMFARNPADPGQELTALSAGCAFNLLFDRTFEVATQSKDDWSVHQRGVLVDIDALYSLVGINQKVPDDRIGELETSGDEEDSGDDSDDDADSGGTVLDDVANSSNEASAAVNQQVSNAYTQLEKELMGFDPYERAANYSGIMATIPLKVVFGEPSERFLTFYGYIDGLDINYTHWTQKMTPVRASVNISMKKLPQGMMLNGTATE